MHGAAGERVPLLLKGAGRLALWQRAECGPDLEQWWLHDWERPPLMEQGVSAHTALLKSCPSACPRTPTHAHTRRPRWPTVLHRHCHLDLCVDLVPRWRQGGAGDLRTERAQGAYHAKGNLMRVAKANNVINVTNVM